MAGRSLRLSTRLGISHGVLVALLVILLGFTLQGLVRMLSLVVDIRDQRLSSVDAEEELHRAAWKIEVAMRHGRASCLADPAAPEVRGSIAEPRADLARVLESPQAPEPLRSAAQLYLELADAALEGDTCAFLVAPSTESQRIKLDEELTNIWIDRLKELHTGIQNDEDQARQIGNVTTIVGIVVALVAAGAAIGIARSTGRSVAEPIRVLAASATRLGEGDFAPIPSVSGPREVEELWRDLERARERLLELDQLKQSFLASVSHEMRSPLTSVREALALLADGTCGDLTPKQRRIAELAMRACEREVRIVEALLDLSRFRSGLPLKREAACDIDQVIEAAVDDERADADRRGVRIEVGGGESTPLLQIDSALVERAIANLVRNAVSVSRTGQSVRVQRSVVEVDGQRTLAVDVIDDGPGLPEELRGVLFRPFSTAAVSSVGRPAGIGLGLSFAREVARAHGGDIKLPREDTKGTTFRIELPLQPTPPSRAE
ncbi:MAG: HAMP domain-containing histidine kinase [Labilithrix sp.]|nr:HAMP domain-containing histidine kinase [Labilithrix sp.]